MLALKLLYAQSMITRTHLKNPKENGSVLFMILIAVALFGALGFAVSNMMRGGPTDIGKETGALRADEIIEYGRKMREAVQAIRISNDCSDTDISFENNTVAGYNFATRDECKIFNPDGGGMTYIKPETIWLDSTFSANAAYGQLFFTGRTCVDTLPDGDYTTCYSDGLDNEELIFVQPFIQQSLCLSINDKLGITNPSGDAPLDVGCSWSGAVKFTGSFSEGLAIGNASGELDGKLSGCYRHDAGCAPMPGSYHYYQVLIVR